MDAHLYRVDPRMIPPVVLGMGFGVFLIILEGATQRGLLLLVLLLPFLYLGAEILARKIVVDSDGITVSKLLRSVRLSWSDVNNVDAVSTGSKVFLILQGNESRPTLITNTIRPFKDLVDRVMSRVPAAAVSEEARRLLVDPPSKHGPLVQAWVVCVVLTGLVAGKVLGYC